MFALYVQSFGISRNFPKQRVLDKRAEVLILTMQAFEKPDNRFAAR
jgi:hypothetical protein